jgi:hypothetical protein
MTGTADDRHPTDDERRLTPAQQDIRDRNAGLPKHLQRSIDRHRQSLGMVPLWGLERRGGRHGAERRDA